MRSHEVDTLPRGGSPRAARPHPASVRHRWLSKIRAGILALAQQETASVFTAFTLPILEEVRELLIRLADADDEGYSREILRNLRDSLMNGGWERYRDATVRLAVAGLIEELAQAEEVNADQVSRMQELIRVHRLTDAISCLQAASVPLDEQDDGEEKELPR